LTAGRDALPRDPALHVWKPPFADFADAQADMCRRNPLS